MSERLWHLKQCELFQRLRPDQLKLVETRCRSRRFPRNSPIYLPADYADGVFLLAEGRAKIGGVTEDGKQTILGFIEPGELFGELSLLGAPTREEYAHAVEKTLVLMIPRDLMEQLIEQNPQLSMGITKLFGLRRLRIERRLKYLLFRSNRERLVHLLLELAERYGRPTDEGIGLRIKLSHQDLASIIGSTRETVTVVLGELQSEGLITLGRRRVTLLDLKRLAASVQMPTPRLSGV
ncbi:Crp/Fnr family transcriptional regulator [Pirellulales bacterium]|nr:Crp/Fnr family transcriptional regulator [Pirellulales bacterium]